MLSGYLDIHLKEAGHSIIIHLELNINADDILFLYFFKVSIQNIGWHFECARINSHTHKSQYLIHYMVVVTTIQSIPFIQFIYLNYILNILIHETSHKSNVFNNAMICCIKQLLIQSYFAALKIFNLTWMSHHLIRLSGEYWCVYTYIY